MHRNVIRLLPRQRQQWLTPRANTPYGSRTYSAFDYQTAHAKDPDAAAEITASASEDAGDGNVPQEQQTPDSDELRRVLQTLDQKTLLDTKVKLNDLIAHFETLRSTLPDLLPSTYTYKAPDLAPATQTSKFHNPEKDYHQPTTYKYHTPHPRSLHRTLSSSLQSALAQTTHTKAHIHDLQGTSYTTPGDSLAPFREEIGRLTESEKRDRLKEMRWQEDSEGNRGREEAERNLGVVEGIWERGEGRRRSRREEVAREEEGDGGDVGGRETTAFGGVRWGASKPEKKEGKEESGQKKEEEEGSSLAEMQRQLSAEMMK